MMLLVANLATARTYTVEPLPFASALPSKEITSLYQDREGILWIGTTFGVARYDGYTTTVFKSSPEHPHLLTDNSISLVADTEHRVFIGTQEGLNVFDKETWTLTALREGPFAGTEIKYAYADSHGRLWIATAQALYLCDETLRVSHRYDLHAAITSITEDRQKQLWVLTWGKGIYRWNEKTGDLTAYHPVGKSNIPFILYQDREERYWLGTWGDGLYRFYPGREGMAAFERQAVAGEIFFDIEQDERNGSLWMLSYDALYLFRPEPDGTLSAMAPPEGIDPNRMYSTLLKDKNGNFWLGAFDAGYRLAFTAGEPRNYSLSFIKEDTGFDPNINCLQEDPEGILWFNQERGGIGLYDPESGQHDVHPYVQTRNFEVSFIRPTRHAHSMWAASAFVPAVFRIERHGMTLRFADTLQLAHDGALTGHILDLLEDGKGNLWILAERRLFAFNPDGKPLRIDGNLPGNVRSICEDCQGHLWLGTAEGKLFHARTTNATACIEPQDIGAAPSDLHINHLCGDGHEGLWVATALGGLYHFSPKDRTWTDHTAACLPDMPPVLNLLADGNTLWVVTPGAVVRYHPDTQVRHPYEAERLHSPVHAFRNSAACLTRNGQLYAGGHGGIISIDTRRPVPPPHTSPLLLTDLRVGGKSLLGMPDCGARISKHDITLSPGVTRVEFLFASPACPEPENVRMAYRLNGLDTAAITLGKGEHGIIYDRLPKGTYTLEVWQADERGQQVGDIAVYRVTRQPAWYETEWAYLLYIAAALLLLACVAWLYARHIRKKHTRLLREEMTRTKMEYFTNMSHELLTPLTILSCLADEVEQGCTPDSPVAQSVRGNVERLRKLIRQV